MRIEAYTQVQQVYNAQKASKPKTTNRVGFADQFQMSSVSKDIQAGKAALAQTPDIREDIVAPIREQLKNGTYSVDAGSFADKLIAKLEESR